MQNQFLEALEELLQPDASPSLSQIKTLYDGMFSGELDEVEIAACLAGWKCLGVHRDLLAAGAEVMRSKANRVDLPSSTRPLVDNCGTGGDGSNSFNISTASAIVAAACGARVAKHGNRSASSKCGSADLLFTAGFPETLTPPQTARLLETTGMTFFFAPQFHPAMKHIMPVRKRLKTRTIFNFLGPLANPIQPEFQLIGVGIPEAVEPMAHALQNLGIQRGLVVHSEDGLDEISPAAPTRGALVANSEIKILRIDPTEYGLHADLESLKGGEPEFNYNLLTQLLEGQQPGIATAVALNAGATLWIANVTKDLAAGIHLAQEALQNGKAKDFFGSWIAAAKGLAQENT